MQSCWVASMSCHIYIRTLYKLCQGEGKKTMEYLIALLVVIGLYFVIPCKLSDLFKMKKKCEDSEMDGGEYGSKAVTKRKTNKKTKKAIKRTK